jgi:hypothetical protein
MDFKQTLVKLQENKVVTSATPGTKAGSVTDIEGAGGTLKKKTSK